MRPGCCGTLCFTNAFTKKSLEGRKPGRTMLYGTEAGDQRRRRVFLQPSSAFLVLGACAAVAFLGQRGVVAPRALLGQRGLVAPK